MNSVKQGDICFIVNVDWFFHSHRRSLEERLSEHFQTIVIAGDSGFDTSYAIYKFEVRSRVPTLRGLYQLRKIVRSLDDKVQLIVVSPVMVIVCHFLFRNRIKIFYNLSGLGFLRGKSIHYRRIILSLIKFFPVKGVRIFVLQNMDDFLFLQDVFRFRKNFFIEKISGSGHEGFVRNVRLGDFEDLTFGYVGRIRKDKGVLDLIRSVNSLRKNGYLVNLVIWGELDDESRHGFKASELNELFSFKQFLKGYCSDKEQIYNSFNWFCLPSNGEGLSKSAIEASSYSLPLLLSDVEGNRDMVDGNGFLFKYGDTNELQRVILRILSLSKDERMFMSARSRQLFEENWTIDTIYKKWNELLTKYDTISS